MNFSLKLFPIMTILFVFIRNKYPSIIITNRGLFVISILKPRFNYFKREGISKKIAVLTCAKVE